MQFLIDWVCVDVASNVSASPISVVACGLGAAGAVAWLRRNSSWVKIELVCSWCWLLRCCFVVSTKKCCEETNGGLGRLSEISSQKSCLNERAAVIGLVGCSGSAAVVGWITMSSALVGGKGVDSTFGSLVWC